MANDQVIFTLLKNDQVKFLFFKKAFRSDDFSRSFVRNCAEERLKSSLRKEKRTFLNVRQASPSVVLLFKIAQRND